MTMLYLDIETNLAHDEIWCAGWNVDGLLAHVTRDSKEVQRLVNEADYVVGHNIIGFDAPVLERVWGVKIPTKKLVDTLVLSRLWNPSLDGGHSLDAWGSRLKMPKGDFKDYDAGYTQEMHDYCLQDVAITVKLHKYLVDHLDADGFTPECRDLERQVAIVIEEQRRRGVTYDLLGGMELEKFVTDRMRVIEDKFQEMFPPVMVERVSEKTGKSLKPVEVVFNVSSRQQIAEKLIQLGHEKYLTAKTETGKHKIDETVLASIPCEEAQLISEYLTLQKRQGMLAQWNKLCTRAGKIHGRIITNGAVTGRMTHCVPLSTKALSRSGWKSYDELEVGEEILGFNMKAGTKEWTTVKDKHFSVSAPVGSVGTETRRIRCTSEHKLVEVVSPGKPYQRYELRQACKMRKHSAILTNAPYYNENFGGSFPLAPNKYETNHMEFITHANENELNAWMSGFLLADGYFRDGWSFSQAEGHLLDVAQTALYLLSDKRVSRTSKTALKGDNQRWGYSVKNTGCAWIRARDRMEWVEESVEPVWCPETELGTWVLLQEDGLITISGNSTPNLAQVPSCSGYLGKECRGLFRPSHGKAMVGIDASALELCMLAHYMKDEEFTKAVAEGRKEDGTDVHTLNQHKAGLPSRDAAKTFIYALCYGAGAGKIGSIIDGGAAEGGRMMAQFMAGMPKFQVLKDKVDRLVQKDQTLPGLDGRVLRVRSAHSALNTLLQGAGAVVMKKALVIFYMKLRKAKLDAQFLLNVHDEWQLECSAEIAEKVGQLGVDSIREAGEHFNMRCPLTGEYKVGNSWAETH